MNSPFDELTRNLARPMPRRAALKQVGVGLAVAALAAFGLASKAQAWAIFKGGGKNCQSSADCPKSKPYCVFDSTGRGICIQQFGPRA